MEKLIDALTRYKCTLSAKDRAIFREIFSLDNQQAILRLHPFIWGSSATAYYSSIVDQRFTLFKLPRIDQVLVQYDKEKLLKTIDQFPLDLSLNPDDDDGVIESREDLYDPRFILLSIYHLLSPHNLINCSKFINLRGLSIVLVCTSSNQPSIRSLAYAVLNRFYSHLESAKASSLVYLWTHFVNCFRSTLKTENQKNPYLLTVTLVLSIEVINSPKSPLFPYVKDFVGQKASFENSCLAKFFLSLLRSNDLSWKMFQSTALNILAKSVFDEGDFKICTEFDLYKIIFSLYTSEWTDKSAKLAILKFIKRCVSIHSVLEKLIVEDAIIPWLTLIVVNGSNFTEPTIQELEQISKIIRKSRKHLRVEDEMITHSIKILYNCVKKLRTE
ncbi:nucleolar pre-ribosomal-associated protein 1-like [Brevipalpus obovatus]|uniref:nucleolar pre-ribosomal-associated protein 1-like n=1 Tax=Brevipalpus obovatus TaxID=246614 RepID=UPI003D9EDA4E